MSEYCWAVVQQQGCTESLGQTKAPVGTFTVKISQMSNEKNPGWLGYIGDYTTQLYRDYIKPL